MHFVPSISGRFVPALPSLQAGQEWEPWMVFACFLHGPFSLALGQKQAVWVEAEKKKKERKRERQCLCLCTFSLCGTSPVWYTEFHLAPLHTHIDIHTHVQTLHTAYFNAQAAYEWCMKEWLEGFCSPANSESETTHPQPIHFKNSHLLSDYNQIF